MRKSTFLLLMLTCVIMTALAEDSTKIKRPKFVSFQMAEGIVLPTTKIIKNETKAPNVTALGLKYGLRSKGDQWEDIYWGMPYWGIGFYKPFYSLSREMGQPLSVFLFQGAQWKEFSSGLSLHYEINLGVSFNWRHYDVVNHPRFTAVGSGTNAHLGGNIYLNKPLSKRLDFHLGVDFLHFSNGSLRTPNYGINSTAAIVEFSYKLKEEKGGVLKGKPEVTHLGTEKRFVHDVSFFITQRTVSIDTIETNLRSKYPKHHFRVAGLNYACLWRSSQRLMWGPSVEMLYDEGKNAKISVPDDEDSYKEVVELGKMSDRFSIGLSLKGELTMPGYSVFAHLGYEVLYANSKDQRLYQIYGAKMYLTENLSTSFAVKSNNLTQSKFMYLSLGYTF